MTFLGFEEIFMKKAHKINLNESSFLENEKNGT
jgi:hypothetical protein